MKRFFCAAVLIALCGQTSLAEEVVQNEKAQQEPQLTWEGPYGGVYGASTTGKATGTHSTGSYSPYSIDANTANTNIGFFLGYNHSAGPVIIGLEANMQDRVAEDKSSSLWNGKINYDKLREYKLRLGYPSGQFLPYTFYGGGSVEISWSAYPTTVRTYSNYRTMGIGLDYKVNDSLFVGLEYAKSSVDIAYLSWNEDTDLSAIRFRVGYQFQLQTMINPTPPKPNTQPTTPEAPKAEPNNALADSVTVKAGIVAVRKWMAEGKGKG